MKKFSAVLVNLQNPREKVWGILLSIQSSGVTVRGIDLNSFDDWSRSVGRGDSEMALSTMFLPIHRVERINQDESVGNIRSLADLFEERVQKDVWTHLGLESGPAAGDRVRRSDWMSLEDAETDYLERVLEDCDGDRAAAAEILGLKEAALNDKLS
jgi:DNA-binding protein Fis